MIETIGVIGAGVMGQGLSIAMTASGINVILVDLSETILNDAKLRMLDDVRAYALLSGDSQHYDPGILSRIETTTALAALERADYVIENVTERWDVKALVYSEIDKICRENVIFGVNTSALPITRVAALTQRPSLVVGTHFMNPAPLKPTVEVISGYHTSDWTVDATRQLLNRIGKSAIVVADSPGFVTNRVMMLMVNEAIFLLQEQIATAPDIDRLFIQCFSHRMGPLQTADLIGLDTVLLSIEVLYNDFHDSKYRPCPLLVKMVDAGLYGRKSGQGFYTYSVQNPQRPEL